MLKKSKHTTRALTKLLDLLPYYLFQFDWVCQLSLTMGISTLKQPLFFFVFSFFYSILQKTLLILDVQMCNPYLFRSSFSHSSSPPGSCPSVLHASRESSFFILRFITLYAFSPHVRHAGFPYPRGDIFSRFIGLQPPFLQTPFLL